MEPLSKRHAVTLAKYADEYKEAGFDVVVEPDDAALPAFLRGFRPDLIATSKEKNYVLELKVGDRSEAQGRWAELAVAVESQPSWHFRLVILGQDEQPSTDFETIPRQVISSRLESARDLNSTGHSEAALLLAWSGFEAAARHRLLQEGIAPKAVSPKAIIKHLVYVGALSQDDIKQIERLIDLRNATAHGFVKQVSPSDVDSLTTLANLLLSSNE